MAQRFTHMTNETIRLNVIIRYYEASKLFTDLKAGWYWWWSAKDPEGDAMVSVRKGPFDSAAACYEDAKEKGSGL